MHGEAKSAQLATVSSGPLVGFSPGAITKHVVIECCFLSFRLRLLLNRRMRPGCPWRVRIPFLTLVSGMFESRGMRPLQVISPELLVPMLLLQPPLLHRTLLPLIRWLCFGRTWLGPLAARPCLCLLRIPCLLLRLLKMMLIRPRLARAELPLRLPEPAQLPWEAQDLKKSMVPRQSLLPATTLDTNLPRRSVA